NFAGFVAENILNGLTDVVYPDTIPADAVVLDVREPEENALGSIPGSINIRLGDLRSNLDKLDKSKLIVCCCQVGLRGYLAERILKQNGFNAANLSGGYMGWKFFFPTAKQVPVIKEERAVIPAAETLDVRSLPCPGPVLKLKNKLESMPEKSHIHLLAAATFETDLLNWAANNGNTVVNLKQLSDGTHFIIMNYFKTVNTVPHQNKILRSREATAVFSVFFRSRAPHTRRPLQPRPVPRLRRRRRTPLLFPDRLSLPSRR
ncbi:MAG: sulfurtransferase TusA family protein, partial [Oscillospiraceae bacterium]|nr:sulfurtransferase TusA family protein [Oscillospiraceae bacterium]